MATEAGSAVVNDSLTARVEALEDEVAGLKQRLDALLDRLDNDEVLSKEDQAYVDLTLDRIDALMEQLGIELGDDEDDEAPEEKQEDILQLLKRGNPKDTF